MTGSNQAPPDRRAIFDYLRSRLGGQEQPRVHDYRNEGDRGSVDIMSVAGVPAPNQITYATIGLSEHSINTEVEGQSLRVEVLILGLAGQPDAGNILSTCAFNVINSQMGIAPGAVHTHVVSMYLPNSPMKHIFFWDPFPWQLESLTLPSMVVAFLLAVPISQEEYELWQDQGPDALATVLERHSPDVADLHRPSVVQRPPAKPTGPAGANPAATRPGWI